MKTWRQGVIGRVEFQNTECAYLKCLKYPLAGFYRSYKAEEKVLEQFIFYAFLKLETLKQIDKIDLIKLSLDEKKLGLAFELNYLKGAFVCINYSMLEKVIGFDKQSKSIITIGLGNIKDLVHQ